MTDYDYKTTTLQIQKTARQWLKDNTVKYVIGYERGTGPLARPVVVRKPEDAGKLVWGPTCIDNLTRLVVNEMKVVPKRGEEPDTTPIGVVLKSCDSKTLVELIKENIVPPERVHVIGVRSTGTVDPRKLEKFLEQIPANERNNARVVDRGGNYTIEYEGGKVEVSSGDILAGKCLVCVTHNPVIARIVVGTEIDEPATADTYPDLAKFDAMSQKERWEYWAERMERCVRCYACRNACPLCYCEECIFDKEKPYRWIERSVDLKENSFYHIIRAMHLAGRCVDCGECERSCPVDIPLRHLNRFLLKRAKERFKIFPGMDKEAPPMFGSYDVDDSQEEIW